MAAAATTTYPFTYTTYTNPTPQPFTKPKTMPTGIFSFAPVRQCSTPSAAPTGSPLDKPTNQHAACAISNAYEVSDHAFWDMYACCKGLNITAVGKPLPCSAVCMVGEDQTWQEVGECLSKRASVVVCKPDFKEIGRTTSSSAASNSATGSPTGAAPENSAAQSSAPATNGAGSVGVTHASFSKMGVAVFGIMVVSSLAGMFL